MQRTDRHLDLGRFGEEYAARHLIAQGFALLRRNWRSAAGEVDIVAAQAGITVLCEVKTRRGERFGHPIEAIDSERLQRLAGAADCWLKDHPDDVLRIDAIAIQVLPEAIELQHVAGVAW